MFVGDCSPLLEGLQHANCGMGVVLGSLLRLAIKSKQESAVVFIAFQSTVIVKILTLWLYCSQQDTALSDL